MWTGLKNSFGWNHYGTKWATGKRIPKEDVDNARFWSFGRTEQVAEKDGVQIGVKGENGHPYIGMSVPFFVKLMLSPMGIPEIGQLYQ